MSTIASLAVSLSIQTAAFTAGLKKGGASLKNFVGSLSDMKGALASVGAAVGVGAAVNSLRELTSHSMEAIDVNAKMSDKLGISTEALIGLQHAAALAGSSAAGMNAGLEVMERSVGAAALGVGLAGPAFNALGLDAQQLAAMRPEEAFMAISDALKEVGNPMERAALAQKIFRGSAQELLPTLLQGSDALRAQAAEAVALGLAYNRVDAAQVEAANDALTRSGEAIQGIGNTIAIGLAPFIEAVANEFTSFASSGVVSSNLIIDVLHGVATGVATIIDFFDLLKFAWKGAQIVVAVGAAGLITLFAQIADGLNFIVKKMGGEGFDTTFIDNWAKEAQAQVSMIGNDIKNMWNAKSAVEKVDEVFNRIRDKAKDNAINVAVDADLSAFFGSIEQGALSFKSDAQKQAAVDKDLADFFGPIEKNVATAKAVKPAELKAPEIIGREMADLFVQRLSAQQDPMAEIADNTDETKDNTKDTADAANRTADAIEGLPDALNEALDFETADF